MKVSRLAKEIGLSPAQLYRELIHRGLQIKGVEYPIDTYNADAIRDAAKEGGKIDFDSLFGPIRDEYKDQDTVKEWDRREGDGRTGDAFERDVGNLIRKYYPNSHLTGLFLFIAEQLSTTDQYGRELDHLIHVRNGDVHQLFIIECKASKLEPTGKASIPIQHKEWIVETSAGRKDVKGQMWLQARSLLQLLKPLPEINLHIQGIVVLPDPDTDDLVDERGHLHSAVSFRSLSYAAFEAFLEKLYAEGEVLRVGQSELLRRLRQGMPCPVLGHPDIRDAIKYHQRARLTLDFGLFQGFSPIKGKWAINGTAGMGKSVLLAYTLCVLCTDHHLSMDVDGRLRLETFDGGGKGWPELAERKIVVFSLKEKQRKIVLEFWKRLIEIFQQHDTSNQLRIQRPDIRLLEQGEQFDENVVLIDEAHDLTLPAQEKIAEWLQSEPDKRYLVIACDRHQKLRLLDDSSSKRMIAGLDFSGQTKKLKRVYRNPFSVYSSGLALMFRWFSSEGPKVIPSETQLTDAFGFQVTRRDTEAGTGCKFEMVEDAHPANNWHHCVSEFPDAQTAYSWLEQYNLSNQDVLWCRFSKEDADFDYEHLHRFQYHNLHSPESTALIDKYIKGQEFPVVVIEGVGPDFNNLKKPESMFVHRREIYLCSSRATVFLFFIHNPEVMDDSAQLVRDELRLLQKNLSRPVRKSNGTQFWGVQFPVEHGTVPLNQFEDLVDPIEDLTTNQAPAEEAEQETSQAVQVAREIEDSDTTASENQDIDHPSKAEPNNAPIEKDHAEEATPTTFEDDLRNQLSAELILADLKPSQDGHSYTLIDHFNVERAAHYLGVDTQALAEILIRHKKLETPDTRIAYPIIADICGILSAPKPWDHPEHGCNQLKLHISLDSKLLQRKNLETQLFQAFKRDGLTRVQIKAAIKNSSLDLTKKPNSAVRLGELASILKSVKIDGQLVLSRLQPVWNLPETSSETEVDEPLRETVESDANTGGYTVFDTYTPKELAAYLDLKPFQVVGKLMKMPEVRDFKLNEVLKLATVEKVCEVFEKVPPWEHPQQGYACPEIFFNGKAIHSSKVANIIKQHYRLSKKSRLSFLHNFVREELGEESNVSANQLYRILKHTNVPPESLLQTISSEQ